VVDAYGRSLVAPDRPWADFARSTVEDWLELLELLAAAQPAAERRTTRGVPAVLRGALFDLLATGDVERTTAAVEAYLK
jgi:hypothetical protein